MPTTVATSDLTVITRELITLNGNQYDSVISKIIPSIKEVTKRIITIPTSSVDGSSTFEGVNIFQITSTLTTGPYAEADIRYVRITNLDDTNYITLQLKNEGGGTIGSKLDFGNSFILAMDNGSGSIDTINSSADVLTHTDTTVDFTSGSVTVTCDSNSKIRVGQALSGSTYFPTGSQVATLNTLGATTSFTLNNAATTTQANATVTFLTGLQDLEAIYAVADVENVDIEVFIAST